MRTMQRFDNSLFDTTEVMEVLSIYFGTVTVQECLGTKTQRYPDSWTLRTIIKAARCEFSTSAYGLGYGADWKGKKITHRANGACEVREGRAIKAEVREYLDESRIPGYAVKIAAQQIRQANMVAWTLMRNDRVKPKVAAVHPRPYVNGHV